MLKGQNIPRMTLGDCLQFINIKERLLPSQTLAMPSAQSWFLPVTDLHILAQRSDIWKRPLCKRIWNCNPCNEGSSALSTKPSYQLISQCASRHSREMFKQPACCNRECIFIFYHTKVLQFVSSHAQFRNIQMSPARLSSSALVKTATKHDER